MKTTQCFGMMSILLAIIYFSIDKVKLEEKAALSWFPEVFMALTGILMVICLYIALLKDDLDEI